MKHFHQNLLIVVTLSLCILCAFQWYGQTQQRIQIERLNERVTQDLTAIQGYTNSIKTLDGQIAQTDSQITEWKRTLKANDDLIVSQKRELNRLEVENESLTNQITQYRSAIATFQDKLKEAYEGIKKQNDAITDLVVQRDEFVQKLNDSVKERNEIVAKYNELAAQTRKLENGKQ